MKEHKLGIRFGAMAPSPAIQLRKQGFKFDKEVMSHFNKDREAINRLRIRQVISDSVANKAYENLLKKIMKHLADHKVSIQVSQEESKTIHKPLNR